MALPVNFIRGVFLVLLLRIWGLVKNISKMARHNVCINADVFGYTWVSYFDVMLKLIAEYEVIDDVGVFLLMVLTSTDQQTPGTVIVDW